MDLILDKKEIWILRIAYVLSFILVITGMYYDHQKYNSYSETAIATITDVWDEEYTHDNGDVYYEYKVKYTFTLNGKKYTGKQKIESQVKKGSTIVVYYPPNKPQKNCIEVREEPWEALIALLIALTILVMEEHYIGKKEEKIRWETLENSLKAEKAINNTYINSFLIILALTIFYSVFILPKQPLIFEVIIIYVSCFCALVVGLLALILNRDIKKILKDSSLMDDLKTSQEIKSSWGGNVYFAGDHLTSVGYSAIKIFYTDILLIGVEKSNDSDASFTHSVTVITRDFKKNTISNGNLETQEQIAKELKNRVPEALDGYTLENKEKIKEMKKKFITNNSERKKWKHL